MKKERRTNHRYSAEFKIRVILDMRNNHLGYHETVYKYWDVKNSVEAHNHLKTLNLWERIYLEEGEKGFMEEKRGRAKGDKKRTTSQSSLATRCGKRFDRRKSTTPDGD